MPTHKIVVITGANSGIGLSTAKELAAKGYNIITICRNKNEGEKTVAELKAINPEIISENFSVDLSDLGATRKVAETILAKYSTIDRLINNAGYYPPQIEYVGNIEKTFLASHLGHMVLTLTLLPALQKASEARVINVSSSLHSQGNIDRFFKRVAGLSPANAYGDAKLANVLFTVALSARIPEFVTTYTLHPGVVRTNFGKNASGIMKVMISLFRPFFITPDQGAVTSVFLVDEPIQKLKSFSGKYFDKKKVKKPSTKDAGLENAAWFWDKSMEIVKPYLI